MQTECPQTGHRFGVPSGVHDAGFIGEPLRVKEFDLSDITLVCRQHPGNKFIRHVTGEGFRSANPR